MKNIHRRKPVHSHSLQNVHGQGAAAPPLTESERRNLKGEIQILKHDKQQLLLEFQRQEQEQNINEIDLLCLKDRLENLEQKQQNMLSSVSQVLQKPGVELSLYPLTENTERKRRYPRNSSFSDEASIEDPIEISQMLCGENADSTSVLSLSMERLDLLDSSIMYWENIMLDLGEASFQSHSNIDFDDSINCADSPDISCVQLDFEVLPKSPMIDVNPEPAVAVVPYPVASEEQPAATAPVTTGVNDVFWEQFLTENPGSNETSGKNNEGKPGEQDQFWWDYRNIIR